MHLTPQQQAVVAHDRGPALVFAVAGAGKTTAMIHRIERLVREEICPAAQILATSFNRESALELRRRLRQWPHCQPVQVSTLHSLGYQIIQEAQRGGLLPTPRQGLGPDQAQDALRRLALQTAQEQRLPWLRELYELEWTDFWDYVGACKGNLRYADLETADLPPAALALATQAEPPSEALDWYLALYQLVERLRRANGWVTFDDMLLTSWELLQRHPDLLRRRQARYQTVLVDEFQDINLAQSEILDMLAAPHGNYMAIGDDDQTIYEWRGAQPSFILNFEQRYGATVYVMDENFRCPAGPLVLANAVIRCNKKRHPKQLHLTQGFRGETRLHTTDSWETLGKAVVDQIAAEHRHGRRYADLAVLVRLNGQTPFVEQQLIARGIPYRVSQPFYERWEIAGLLGFAALAVLEGRLRAGETLSKADRDALQTAWQQCYNRPKRYISRRSAEEILHSILGRPRSIAQVLREWAGGVREAYLIDRLLQFADDLAWTAERLAQPAGPLLVQLEQRLRYIDYVRESTAHPQLADGRALSVQALLRFAHGAADLPALLAQIEELRQARPARGQSETADAVTLSTIHQAKGLEWPVVLVPNLNDGIFPFLRSSAGDAAALEAELEEERRLLYVAVTRAREHLHLYTVQSEPPSRFLEEADAGRRIALIAAAGAAAAGDPARLTAEQLHALVLAVRTFALQRYFERWWSAAEARKTALAAAVLRLREALEQNRLWQAAQLTPADLAWWGQWAAAPLPPPLPGLAEWRAALRRPSPPARPRPDGLLRLGDKVTCDVGRGVVQRIVGERGRPLTSGRPAEIQFLYVALPSGLQVRLDLRQREIVHLFTGERQLLVQLIIDN